MDLKKELAARRMPKLKSALKRWQKGDAIYFELEARNGSMIVRAYADPGSKLIAIYDLEKLIKD